MHRLSFCHTTMYYDVNAIIGAVKTTVTLTVAYPRSSLVLDHPSAPGRSSKLIPHVHTAKPNDACGACVPVHLLTVTDIGQKLIKYLHILITDKLDNDRNGSYQQMLQCNKIEALFIIKIDNVHFLTNYVPCSIEGIEGNTAPVQSMKLHTVVYYGNL